MKRKLLCLSLALAMLCAVTLPCAAAFFDTAENEKLTPPPELIIEEGERWIPDAVDPFSVSTYGSDAECGHNGHPDNYRYLGAVEGNTEADAQAVDLVTKVVTLGVPKPFKIVVKLAFKAIDVLEKITEGDKLQGNYIKYQYIYNFGLDPNMYWFHTVYEFETEDQIEVGNACYATYSPKKSTSDPFQD